MLEPSESPPDQADSFDRIAVDLQTLRETAGHVSYAELVRRITALRTERGVPSAAAIPARSTVYNAFKAGRARMDAELLRDIVAALGVDEQELEAWVQRCRRARRASDAASKQRIPMSAEELSRPAQGGRTLKLSQSLIVLLLIACVAVNLLGLYTTHVFKLSVYLDMVGTAIASIAFGPWHGVAVAIASSNLGFLTGDPTNGYFTLVNITGALLWGYGVRRLGLGASFTRYFSLNVGVAIGCSLVAAPIVVMVFSGHNGHASGEAVLSLEALGLPMIASVFSANIITSIMDKLLTGFIGLLAFTLLHSRFRLSADHLPLVEKLGAPRIATPVVTVRPGSLRPIS